MINSGENGTFTVEVAEEALPEADISTKDTAMSRDSLVVDQNDYNLDYILQPLHLTMRLQLNPRPEHDTPAPFSIPKLTLKLTLHNLDLCMSRLQYSGAMDLLESIDRMRVSARYRKHRSALLLLMASDDSNGSVGKTKREKYRLWWYYAYDCNIESIQRVARNWSWAHIRAHRARCREYKQAYKEKLLSGGGTPSKEVLQTVEECERELDLFNLTLVRRQAEVEVRGLPL